jgi:hypothetical protein
MGGGGGYIFLIKDTAWTWNPKINCHIERLREKCLYQVRVITVFTVFRLLTDFVCLYNYEF